ncbi:MAG TPA: hypothetical protein VMG10_10720 [Gemmataceae bacterium]|nr:hypothetical protein [Gemmataceae bacterium]
MFPCITHSQIERELLGLPLSNGQLHPLHGCLVVRCERHRWQVDGGEPLPLLAAIDSLMRRHRPVEG